MVLDNPTDRTAQIAKEFSHSTFRLFTNAATRGASFSRNLGIQQSQGDIIILLDSDSYVDRDWIAQHVEAHNTISAGIIGGAVRGIYNTFIGRCDGLCAWWTSIPHAKSRFITKFHLPTNNLSIKKRVFENIGAFDEQLKIGGEDAEFCFRAIRANIPIYFKSDIIVSHFDRNDWKGYIRHQENWGKHAVKMRKQHRMDVSFLMPGNPFTAFLYIVPLAMMFTLFLTMKWLRYSPSILLYTPLILAGKLKQTTAIFKSQLKNQ